MRRKQCLAAARRAAVCASATLSLTSLTSLTRADAIDNTWLGGSGSWNDPTKWSAGVVPNNSGATTFRVTINNGFGPSVNISPTVDSLTIDNNSRLADIETDLRKFGIISVDKDQTIICIVGSLPKEKSGYAQQVFEALRDVPLRMVSYGGSAHNISVLVHGDLKKKALQALNKGLFRYS